MTVTVNYGGHSMFAPLRRVLLRHPRDAFRNQGHLDVNWRSYSFEGCPDYQIAIREYRAFEELLAAHVPEVVFADPHDAAGMDSLYIHDPVVITNIGAILCNMEKPLRRGEPGALTGTMRRIGIPIAGAIEGDGRLEAGDVLWLDETTLAVGYGPRTNLAGIEQLRTILRGHVGEVLTVPLPAGAFHLLGLISIVDRDLAIVSRRLPTVLRERLLGRGAALIEVPEAEQRLLGCNVLAVAPRRCILVHGSPCTVARLRSHDAEVWQYAGNEISLRGMGGPTCLTRPLLRGSGIDAA